MGQGVVRTLAQAGIHVLFKEKSEEKVKEAVESISMSLNREIDRWGLTSSEKAAILSRIEGTTATEKLRDVELVIESIMDDLEKKKALYVELDYKLDSEMIIACNTSSLSVTELAHMMNRPGRVCGMHFFHPVHKRPLIEVIRGVETSE